MQNDYKVCSLTFYREFWKNELFRDILDILTPYIAMRETIFEIVWIAGIISLI